VGRRISIIIRLQLGSPIGMLNSSRIYNVLITAHALVIIFFIVIPTLIGGFGNWLLPLIVGAPDIAYPRLNALSLWLLFGSLYLLLTSSIVDGGSGTR